MKTFKQYKVNEKSLAGSVAGKAKGQIIPFLTLFNTPDGWESEFGYTNVKGDRKIVKSVKGEVSDREVRKILDDIRKKHSVK